MKKNGEKKIEYIYTKYITLDNRNYRMNKETNKEKFKWNSVIQNIEILTTGSTQQIKKQTKKNKERKFQVPCLHTPLGSHANNHSHVLHAFFHWSKY